MVAQKKILLTGGAGFIAVNRLKLLADPHKSNNLEFHLGDLRNKDDIEKLFSANKFDAVIHFAGLKAVGESVEQPFRYFDNNLIGSINLYQIMAKYNCKKVRLSYSFFVLLLLNSHALSALDFLS